ncbi:diguanylate cyclase (GGDEF)-like protein/PAS domain S-box-containing protein [Bradyrhizobium sp. GM6.1]
MFLAAKHGWEAAIRRGPVLWLTLCGVLLVAGIFAVTAMAVGEFRERTLTNRERELENTVQLIARHFDQQFEDADVVAADVIGQTRQYLLVNRTAEEQFGQSSENIVGKTPFDIYPDASARVVTDDDSKALQMTEGLFKDEHAWQSQAKGMRYITSTRIGIRDNSGEPRYLINVVEDVTERRRADEKIAHMAHYDALTDLPNRTLFREQIERELEKVGGGSQFALLYIDVDEFKGINDSLGHHVGDELLKGIAARIRGCLGQDDLIARLGGDEFAVIQTGIKSSADVVSFVTRIFEAIRRPYHCFGHQLSTDASIGIAMAPQDGTDLDQAHQECRSRDVRRQGRRTPRSPLLRAGDGCERQGAPEPGAGSAAGPGERRFRDPLSAAGRLAHQ